MPLTIVPLMFNLVAGTCIWASHVATSWKVMLTAILLAKYAIFYISALVIDTDTLKKCGIAITATLNVLMIFLTAANAIYSATFVCGTLLVLLAIWYCMAFVNIRKKDGERQ